MKKKMILVIIDGGAEPCTTHEVRQSCKSAFVAAKKPYLDMLASNSHCGLWRGPYAPAYNKRSMSSVATLEILGYSYEDEPGRGYLEALGLGLKPGTDSICLRGNFATVDNKKNIIDRRAGRDHTGLDKLTEHINKSIPSIDGVCVKVHRLIGHRIVLILTGKGLNKHVTDEDISSKAEKIRALHSSGEKTAKILNEFIERSAELLSKHSVNKTRKKPANFILLRSAGSKKTVEPFSKKYKMRACVLSGVNIVLGMAKYLGIDILESPLTEAEDDLPQRVKKIIDAIDKYDFLVLHINGADTAAHDKDFSGKVRYIEKIDREVFSKLLKLRSVYLSVICDHITDSKTGEHDFGPVPFLLYDCEDDDNELHGKYDEKSCAEGFITANPMSKILSVL